ncbi:hypothetical protein [Micromonospora sp. HK10]|uniref:hypothetical protein n=1 Tax=Micromonospora sp. HK10 TaxID=1538294 RepID=UPI0012E0DE4C|nr:hypothetical protein [Micromonospora sp. HK10]
MPVAPLSEPTRSGWLDRRRDLRGWLLTPLTTLVVAPVTAGAVAMVMLVGGAFDGTPALCEPAVGENRCEEVTLGMLGEHVVLAAAVWLLLWLVPWWRGLRKLRLLLAIIVCAVLVAAPIRMAG